MIYMYKTDDGANAINFNLVAFMQWKEDDVLAITFTGGVLAKLAIFDKDTGTNCFANFINWGDSPNPLANYLRETNFEQALSKYVSDGTEEAELARKPYHRTATLNDGSI